MTDRRGVRRTSEAAAAARARDRASVRVEAHKFDADGTVPNNPSLVMVVMRGALEPPEGAEGVKALLENNGWFGVWDWQVFPFQHYHPNAHEVLAVASGFADLTLGGPNGVETRVEAGDVLVLPAGTGHCQRGASADFVICGAYPPGQEDYETIRAEDEPPVDVAERIARVALPRTDPIYGADGPLLNAWRAAIKAPAGL